MGFYDLTNPARAGSDVAKFDGWSLANTINHFINNADLTTEYGRTQFRRACLVSQEFNNVSKGVRFGV